MTTVGTNAALQVRLHMHIDQARAKKLQTYIVTVPIQVHMSGLAVVLIHPWAREGRGGGGMGAAAGQAARPPSNYATTTSTTTLCFCRRPLINHRVVVEVVVILSKRKEFLSLNE